MKTHELVVEAIKEQFSKTPDLWLGERTYIIDYDAIWIVGCYGRTNIVCCQGFSKVEINLVEPDSLDRLISWVRDQRIYG